MLMLMQCKSIYARLTPRVLQRRQSQPLGVKQSGAYGLGVGRGGANPQGSGEAEFAHLGVGWSCSRTLDFSDESMLMVISYSFSDILVLVPTLIFSLIPILPYLIPQTATSPFFPVH